MKTKCRVGYHFYKLKSWKHRLITLFTFSSIGHVIISVQTDNGIAYYNCTWGRMGQWFSELSRECTPFDSLYENTTMDLKTLDLLLPQNTERYSMWRVILHCYTGLPRFPSSCISSVHRTRFLMGKKTKGRSPGGLYHYLREELHDSTRASG